MPGLARRRVYTGATQAEAKEKFEADAAEAARFDWLPTAMRSWRGTSLTVMYEPRQPAERPDDTPADASTDQDATATPPGESEAEGKRGDGWYHEMLEERAKKAPSRYRPGRLNEDLQDPPKTGTTDTTTQWLLVIIAVLVGAAAFWIIATPHEQCYVSDGRYGPEYPITKTGPDTYRGVPSEFWSGEYISSSAEIDCRWELGD